MQESESPSQITRARAEKLREMLTFMEDVTTNTLHSKIKFEQLDQFYQFLTKFGAEEVTQASQMKSPCSTGELSRLQERTRKSFINKVSQFLFEMEKNRQVVKDLETFLEKGEEMKTYLIAKSYNAYHSIGNELNKELLSTITDGELEMALQISKQVVTAITSFNFSEFQPPELTSMFAPVTNKLETALDPPSSVRKTSPVLHAVPDESPECEEEVSEIPVCLELEEPEKKGGNALLEREFDEPIKIIKPKKMRGSTNELWDQLTNLVSQGEKKENEVEKLESQQKTDVMVKSLCLTNLMMKMFREDYTRLLKDIRTVHDKKLSLKLILASKQIQEQIEKLKAKPSHKTKKFSLPQLKTYERSHVEHWKRVIKQGASVTQKDLLKFNKPIINSFSRAGDEMKPPMRAEVPLVFEEQEKQPFKDMRNIEQSKTKKRKLKSQQKNRERSSMLSKEHSRQTISQNS